MTFLGLEARTDLPKVGYPTALDFFVFLSFGFIFATIIQVNRSEAYPDFDCILDIILQFAVVHYFTKYGSGEVYFSSEFNTSSDSSDSDAWDTDNQQVKLKHKKFTNIKIRIICSF